MNSDGDCEIRKEDASTKLERHSATIELLIGESGLDPALSLASRVGLKYRCPCNNHVPMGYKSGFIRLYGCLFRVTTGYHLPVACTRLSVSTFRVQDAVCLQGYPSPS